MYKSPIEIICGDIQKQIDNDIYRVVQKYDIKVDKNELIQALQYDRDQYEKGYADGKATAMAELVRCKGCMHCNNLFCYHPSQRYLVVYPEHFCAFGERKDEN